MYSWRIIKSLSINQNGQNKKIGPYVQLCIIKNTILPLFLVIMNV